MQPLEKEIEEKILLEELNKIIKELNIDYFNFGEPKEEKLCLEKINNIWYVYYVEKAVKLYIEEFEKPYEACINVLDRLIINKKYKEEYEKKLGRK